MPGLLALLKTVTARIYRRCNELVKFRFHFSPFQFLICDHCTKTIPVIICFFKKVGAFCLRDVKKKKNKIKKTYDQMDFKHGSDVDTLA